MRSAELLKHNITTVMMMVVMIIPIIISVIILSYPLFINVESETVRENYEPLLNFDCVKS